MVAARFFKSCLPPTSLDRAVTQKATVCSLFNVFVCRLVAIPETPLFASSASDGCIRVWDCGKMEGRNIANRSRQVFNRQAGPLVGLAVCENNLSLASASQSGSVFVLRYASLYHITL